MWRTLRQWLTWPSLPTCMYPTIFDPHLPYINLEVWTFGRDSSSSVGLTEINFVSPPFVSLPLDFVSSKRLDLVCLGPLEPGALVPLHPGYKEMYLFPQGALDRLTALIMKIHWSRIKVWKRLKPHKMFQALTIKKGSFHTHLVKQLQFSTLILVVSKPQRVTPQRWQT